MRTIALKKCPRIHALYFSADGARLLVIGGTDSRATAAVSIDVLTGEEIGRVIIPDPTCYNVDPAAARLVIGEGEWEGDATVRWTEVPGGPFWGGSERAATWGDLPIEGAESICDVAFDRAGKLLAVASEPRGRGKCRVDVFQFVPGKLPKHRLTMPTKRAAGAIEFSPNGKRLAVGAGLGGDDVFEVFDLAAGARAFQFDPKVDHRPCVRFLPDGRLAAVGGSKVYVLRANGGKPQFVLGGTGKALVNDIAVSADGRRIVAAMSNATVRFWDATTGLAGPAFAWRVGGVRSVALAPDGLTCAAAGSKGRVVIWDVDT